MKLNYIVATSNLVILIYTLLRTISNNHLKAT